jgi:hypothetical protein
MFKRILAMAVLAGALVGNAFADQYDKPGFVTKVQDGRLWVFKDGSPELADMQKNGIPEKAVMRIAAGPEGMTIKASSDDVIQAYLDAK